MLSLFALSLVDCGVCPYGIYSHRVQDAENKDPKKLFEWAVGEKEEGGNKNKTDAKEPNQIESRKTESFDEQ